MNETNSYETNDLLTAHRGNADSESEARILIQQKVMNSLGATSLPGPDSLENLTRLIQGMSSVHQQNLSPRAITNANSSAASKASDIATGGTRTLPDISPCNTPSVLGSLT